MGRTRFSGPIRSTQGFEVAGEKKMTTGDGLHIIYPSTADASAIGALVKDSVPTGAHAITVTSTGAVYLVSSTGGAVWVSSSA